jgi:hypothetical protein
MVWQLCERKRGAALWRTRTPEDRRALWLEAEFQLRYTDGLPPAARRLWRRIIAVREGL